MSDVNYTLNSPEVIARIEAGGETFDLHVPEWLQQLIESILREHAPAFGQMGWEGIDVVTVTGWDHGEYAFEVLLGTAGRPIILLDLEIAERLAKTFRAHPDREIKRFLGQAYAEAYIDLLGLQGIDDDDEVVVNVSFEFGERLASDGPDSAMHFLGREARALQREFGGPKAWSPRVESW